MLKAGWGQRLRELRGAKSQSTFAGSVGIGLSAWKEYENETRLPRFDTIVAASELSGKSLDWIATGVEAPTVMDPAILEQVVESVELESGDQDAKTKAKLISLLYKHAISLQKKEQDENKARKGDAA